MNHFERSLVKERKQPVGRSARKGSLLRAARFNQLGRVDASYADLALAKLECVAVDDACHSTPRPAQSEGRTNYFPFR